MENMTQLRDGLCYFFTPVMCNFYTQTVFDGTGCQKSMEKDQNRGGREGKNAGSKTGKAEEERNKNRNKSEK